MTKNCWKTGPLTDIDIPMQISVRNHILRAAQILSNRTANQIFAKQKTSTRAYMNYKTNLSQLQTDDALSTLCENYGWAARRSIKPCCSNFQRRPYMRWQAGQQQAKYRRVSPSQMPGFKKFFVFRQNYIARYRHTKDETTHGFCVLQRNYRSSAKVTQSNYTF